ncbi:MAG: hypothetical protein AB1352_03925 [Patescibacteria group bacterium]
MNESKAENVLRAYRDGLYEAGMLRWAQELVKTYPKAEVYLVGGAVRDCLLKRVDTKDYDFVVRNVAARELEACLSRFGTVNYVGKSFGVYKLRLHEPPSVEALDIALPRTEHAWGTGKYRDIDTQSDPALSLKEDLGRRDFTVNAMAMRVSGDSRQLLVDSFGGLKDLEEKNIRTVGNPSERMREDYSRALRGLRFAVMLEFTIEQETWNALIRTVSHLHNSDVEGERIIPTEIIAKEFLGALEARPTKALDLYTESGALGVLLPELLEMKGCPQPPEYHSEGDVWTHTRLALAVLESAPFAEQFRESILTSELEPLWDAETALTVLLHDVGKPATLTTPEGHGTDRIRFHEHAEVGARMAGSIIDRLALTSPAGFGIDRARVLFMVRHHLLFLHGDVDRLRPATIEKYFFHDAGRGEKFLKLCYADAAASIPADGSNTLRDFYRMVARLNTLKEKGRKTLPPPLLTGNEVMEMLGIPEGPRVGAALHKLREAQLEGTITNKKEAVHYLHSQCGN